VPTNLKRSYSAREVAALTGLTARQLQWWDASQLFSASVASRPTKAGGFTERRYTPIELYELSALAEFRQRGFTLHQIRKVLVSLRKDFGVRLFEVLDDTGPFLLRLDNSSIYVQTRNGSLHNLIEDPKQPLLAVDAGDLEILRAMPGRSSRRKVKRKKSKLVTP